MFQYDAIKMLKYLMLATGIILSGCDTCSPPEAIPTNDELAGTYVPDERTSEKFTEMGFQGLPKFIIDSDLKLTVQEMPAVWMDWNWGGNISYDKAKGMVVIKSTEQLLMELELINGLKTKTTFAGSVLCRTNGSLVIRIPYQGWDQGEYLVFKRQKT